MSARNSDRERSRVQAALSGKPAPDVEFEATVAFATTTKRIAAAIARELGLHEKTLQDWGNIHSGDRCPNLQLLWITQLALEMRPLPAQRAECFAALDFIERHLGRVAFSLPAAANSSPAWRARAIAYALVEFAEFIDAVDDLENLSPADRTRAQQELGDVVASCFALMPKEAAE